MRDRSLRNRTIDCPDCAQPVYIEEVQSGLVGVLVEESFEARGFTLRDRYPGRSLIPRLVAIVLTLGVLAGGAWMSGLFHEWGRTDPIVADDSGNGATATGDVGVMGTTDPDSDRDPGSEHVLDSDEPRVPDQQAALPPRGRSSAEIRLDGIHVLIDTYLSRHGVFPSEMNESGIAPAERFSWIARIESQVGAHHGLVDWSQSWQDPVNERFVRRRLPAFQNPAIEQAVGEDGYPASHFAGITGVGPDAAFIPKDHPRAGIFGKDRKTRIEDIRDGLAQTMLVAGVRNGLGSWARAGAATTRSFSTEPYINGPDGFGTGQLDGMFVLMADGSIKFLSRDVDPAVVRHMAAMADGDGHVRPTPAADNRFPQRSESAASVAAAEASERPIDVPLTADIAEIDFDQVLSHRLVKYELTRPAPIGELIREFEELTGVPIDTSQISPRRLDQRVRLTRENATYGELLTDLLSAAEMRFEISSGQLLILEVGQKD